MTRRAIAVAAACLVSAACTTPNGPPFSGLDAIRDGQARLYVYRPATVVASGERVLITLNGRALTRIGNGGFVSGEVPPGRYHLVATYQVLGFEQKLPPRTVTVFAGEAAYCGVVASTDGIVLRRAIECPDESEALADLRSCRRDELAEGGTWTP